MPKGNREREFTNVVSLASKLEKWALGNQSMGKGKGLK